MKSFFRTGTISERAWWVFIIAGFVALYITPVVVQRWNDISPVYSAVEHGIVIRDGNKVEIYGKTTKRARCVVKSGHDAVLLVSWDGPDGRSYRRYILRRADDDTPVSSGHLYRPGDSIPVGPFAVTLVGDAARNADKVEISIRCKRWGMFEVEARIGPFMIPKA